MTDTFWFVVPGKPKGKSRPRFTLSGHVYTDKQTREYEEQIADNYTSAGGKHYGDKSITMQINVLRKKSKRSRCGLKKKPDVDNVAKIVMDALTGIAYTDDVQVNNLTVYRYYSDQEALEIGIAAYDENIS